MQLVFKISIRVIYLILVVCVCNMWYAQSKRYQVDKNSVKAWMMDDMDSIKNVCDVLYFAESSNASSPLTDSNHQSIAQMTNALIPDITIGVIEKPASHAGIYRTLLESLNPAERVKMVIVTMNIRSFGYDWIESGLENSMNQAAVFYNHQAPIIQRMRAAAEGYSSIPEPFRRKRMLAEWENTNIMSDTILPFYTVRKWDDFMANGSYKLADGTWDMPRIELACNYVKNYAFIIDPKTNPRIQDFDAICALAKKYHWKLVFNILSENTQTAETMCGPALRHLIQENRDFLVKRYSKLGAFISDNLHLVDSSDFTDKNWPTEHYNERGRMKIAQHLASDIRFLIKN